MNVWTRVEHDTGDVINYLNGLVHSPPTGPAIWVPKNKTQHGYSIWFEFGILHREHGPALYRTDGYIEYWIKGIQYTKDEWELKTAHLYENW